MGQADNANTAGYLPTNTEIAAVSTWKDSNNASWTYANLINAGYSDWAIASDYILYKDYSAA